MTEFIDSHTPRPEFRAALERDLVGALRRETRFAPSHRIARSARVRTVMLIVIGAVLGVGCGYASAQVRESQTRSELLSAAEASLKVAQLRLELSQDRLKRIQRMFEAGVITRRELTNAESEARAMELGLAQANLDIEEIRASSTSPRGELWAPVVGGRDFVKQRLQLQAALAQRHLTDAETMLSEIQKGVRVGVMGAGAEQDGRVQLLQAQQEMAGLARQLQLRQQFVESKIDASEVAQQLKLGELQGTISLLETQSKLAEQRMELTKAFQAGVASTIDMKRAELDLLEMKLKLAQLVAELQAFRATIKDR